MSNIKHKYPQSIIIIIKKGSNIDDSYYTGKYEN